MDKDYLIQFNIDGTRLNTYANGIHYSWEPAHEEYDIVFEDGEEKEVYSGFVEEKIINLVDEFNYQDVLDNGGAWISIDDYHKLAGNTDKEYIYKDGEIVEKPPYVPTDEELQQQAQKQLDSEFNTLDSAFKADMLNAILANNTEAIQSLQTEYKEFTQAYKEASAAL